MAYGVPGLTSVAGIVHLGLMSKLVNVDIHEQAALPEDERFSDEVNDRRRYGWMTDTFPAITKFASLREVNSGFYYIPLIIHCTVFVTAIGHLSEASVYFVRAGQKPGTPNIRSLTPGLALGDPDAGCGDPRRPDRQRGRPCPPAAGRARRRPCELRPARRARLGCGAGRRVRPRQPYGGHRRPAGARCRAAARPGRRGRGRDLAHPRRHRLGDPRAGGHRGDAGGRAGPQPRPLASGHGLARPRHPAGGIDRQYRRRRGPGPRLVPPRPGHRCRRQRRPAAQVLRQRQRGR